MLKDVTDIVAQQYNAYAYPKPIEDLDQMFRDGEFMDGDPSVWTPLLWPEGRPEGTNHLLVAGCGTNQAAVYAYYNRDMKVFGIDLSSSSLAHEKYLKQKHGLDNLELLQGDLRSVAQLDRKFELIVSTGVLHHMSEPELGLAALSKVLADDGTMLISLYSSYFRQGVYLIQDCCRALGLGQTPDDIDILKDLLKVLPQEHPANVIVRGADDMNYDSGLVDLFLHVSDKSFTVTGILELLSKASLSFQSWADNSFYLPESAIPKGTRLRSRLESLPDEEQWALIERIRVSNSLHTFTACHPDRRPLRTFNFNDDSWIKLYPMVHPNMKVKEAYTQEKPHWTLQRGRTIFSCNALAYAILSRCTGKNTFSDIVDSLEWPSSPGLNPLQYAKGFCDSMYARGHIFMSKVPVEIIRRQS